MLLGFSFLFFLSFFFISWECGCLLLRSVNQTCATLFVVVSFFKQIKHFVVFLFVTLKFSSGSFENLGELYIVCCFFFSVRKWGRNNLWWWLWLFIHTPAKKKHSSQNNFFRKLAKCCGNFLFMRILANYIPAGGF